MLVCVGNNEKKKKSTKVLYFQPKTCYNVIQELSKSYLFGG